MSEIVISIICLLLCMFVCGVALSDLFSSWKERIDKRHVLPDRFWSSLSLFVVMFLYLITTVIRIIRSFKDVGEPAILHVSNNGVYLPWWFIILVLIVIAYLLTLLHFSREDTKLSRNRMYAAFDEADNLKTNFSELQKQIDSFKIQNACHKKVSDILSQVGISPPPASAISNAGLRLSEFEDAVVKQAHIAANKIVELNQTINRLNRERSGSPDNLERVNKQLESENKAMKNKLDALTNQCSNLRAVIKTRETEPYEYGMRRFAYGMVENFKFEFKDFLLHDLSSSSTFEESRKRFHSAIDQFKNYKFKYLDIVAEVIGGKTPYQTSLISCTCPDFRMRHQKCKHIMMLALTHKYISVEFFNSNQSRFADSAAKPSFVSCFDAFPWLVNFENLPFEVQIKASNRINGFLMEDESMYQYLLDLKAGKY